MDDKVMNIVLKNATISVLLSSAIILINTDLSCLQPYLIKVAKAIEKRQLVKEYKQQKYTVITLPNEAFMPQKGEVRSNMSAYVSKQARGEPTVNSPYASQDASCRGSPSNRSP